MTATQKKAGSAVAVVCLLVVAIAGVEGALYSNRLVENAFARWSFDHFEGIEGILIVAAALLAVFSREDGILI